jgi:hypothetical protein
MKASQLLRGYLQTKRVDLPLAGSHHQLEHDGGPEPDAKRERPARVEVGLVPLSPGDEATIYERATAYARARGMGEPKEGDELYEYGKALHRCLLGVVDPDVTDRREPFFDGGLKQLEDMVELGKDGVLTLAEMHQSYSDEISGLVAELSTEDGYAKATKELAGPDGASFFLSLRPGLRVSWALITAKLLVTSLQDKSSGSSS